MANADLNANNGVLKNKRLIRILALISFVLILSGMVFYTFFRYECVYYTSAFTSASEDVVPSNGGGSFVIPGVTVDDDINIEGGDYIILDKEDIGHVSLVPNYGSSIITPEPEYKLRMVMPDAETLVSFILALAIMALLFVYLYFMPEFKIRIILALIMLLEAAGGFFNIALNLEYYTGSSELMIPLFSQILQVVLFGVAAASLLGRFAIRPLVITTAAYYVIFSIGSILAMVINWDHFFSSETPLAILSLFSQIGWMLFWVVIMLMVIFYSGFSKKKNIPGPQSVQVCAENTACGTEDIPVSDTAQPDENDVG